MLQTIKDLLVDATASDPSATNITLEKSLADQIFDEEFETPEKLALEREREEILVREQQVWEGTLRSQVAETVEAYRRTHPEPNPKTC